MGPRRNNATIISIIMSVVIIVVIEVMLIIMIIITIIYEGLQLLCDRRQDA